MKIISLVPSISELLVDLNLENQLIGVTKYCIHPEHLISTTVNIGGTKTLQIERIKELKADLIIANKEENQKEQIEELMETQSVWVTDIRNLQDNWDFIEELGLRCHVQAEAKQLIDKAKIEWEKVKNIFNNKSALYFIWRKPYMTIGKNTFIYSILNEIGINNLSHSLEGNYPEVSPDWISKQSVDYLLLSSEPYPFKEKHINEFQAIHPKAKIILIDGEMCSWYGSRMLIAPNYFKKTASKHL